jgi:hypothetical protein
MIVTKIKWDRERDLELVKKMFLGFTGEGISEQLCISTGAISSRLQGLGLTFAGARRAKRQGLTPLAYLESSPLYRKAEAQPDLLSIAESKPGVQERFDKMTPPQRSDFLAALAEVIQYEAEMVELHLEAVAGSLRDPNYLSLKAIHALLSSARDLFLAEGLRTAKP